MPAAYFPLQPQRLCREDPQEQSASRAQKKTALRDAGLFEKHDTELAL